MQVYYAHTHSYSTPAAAQAVPRGGYPLPLAKVRPPMSDGTSGRVKGELEMSTTCTLPWAFTTNSADSAKVLLSSTHFVICSDRYRPRVPLAKAGSRPYATGSPSRPHSCTAFCRQSRGVSEVRLNQRVGICTRCRTLPRKQRGARTSARSRRSVEMATTSRPAALKSSSAGFTLLLKKPLRSAYTCALPAAQSPASCRSGRER